jgi:Flp pilus assembly pilin Flp
MFKKLWNDDAGIVTIEYLVLGTFLALALIVGVSTLSAAINAELDELGNAVLSFNQSYYVSGQTSCVAGTPGSAANDRCDRQQISNVAPVACNINDATCN